MKEAAQIERAAIFITGIYIRIAHSGIIFIDKKNSPHFILRAIQHS